MEVEFVCHATVRDAVGEKPVRVDVPEGATVGDALHALAETYEDVGPLVFDGEGRIRPTVNVLVGEENARTGEGTETPLASGETVTLAPGVAGGDGTGA
ncbi:MAG: ubiquitin-like small modifier protein 1 [Halorientalis sp.]